ncbi:unknown [Firmicutes bacterium CAG:114]|nr:unknown [Firmicutes bacterium CAG:114]
MASLIFPTALAAARLGTATRTIWHPAAASRRIWATVASTSWVGVLVMDWMDTGAPPPTGRPPT